MVVELTLQVAGGRDAPAEVRHALRRFHPDLPPELMQVVALLTSELVANAVRHAGADPVAIRFHLTPSHVRVEVTDEGPGFDPAKRRPEPGRPGGWGLHLVDEMSSRWGTAATGQGTQVWFELDR